MEQYDGKFAPVPFGLNNTGFICHFNSLLQALSSCTALIRNVLGNPDYMRQTKTGAAFLEYVSAFASSDGAKKSPDSKIEFQSAKVLRALVEDLRVRRPSVKFGASQESASEGLVLLLDMIEPPEGVSQPDRKEQMPPITKLFHHRYNCEVHCSGCKTLKSTQTDLAVQFFPTHIDNLKTPVRTPKSFSEAIRLHVESTEDYFCTTCGKKQTAYRQYRLAMIPEIVVVLFKVYQQPRIKRFIPDRLEFPRLGGGRMDYKQVAQVEHYGVLSNGHYVAKGVRQDGSPYSFNDSNTPYSTAFIPHAGNENVYIALYHYSGSISEAEVAARAAEMSALSVVDKKDGGSAEGQTKEGQKEGAGGA